MAAEQLFVTKAAISISLHSLEEQLGQPLFDRIKNRLLLNTQGLKLLPLADEVLQRMQGIQSLFSDSVLTGSLRIGASVTIGNHLLPELLAGFLNDNLCQRPTPKIENTSCLASDLLNYQLDIALVEGKIYDDALQVIPWITDEMQVIASAKADLTPELMDKKSKNLTFENIDLTNQDWVLRELNSGTREQFNQQLAPVIGNWNVGLELNSNEAVINAVAAGMGLGFMSNLSVADAIKNKRLTLLPRQQVCTRQLYLVIHKERFVSPLLQCFLDYCLTWQPSADKLYNE